jgi:hypothetical protein
MEHADREMPPVEPIASQPMDIHDRPLSIEEHRFINSYIRKKGMRVDPVSYRLHSVMIDILEEMRILREAIVHVEGREQ